MNSLLRWKSWYEGRIAAFLSDAWAVCHKHKTVLWEHKRGEECVECFSLLFTRSKRIGWADFPCFNINSNVRIRRQRIQKASSIIIYAETNCQLSRKVLRVPCARSTLSAYWNYFIGSNAAAHFTIIFFLSFLVFSKYKYIITANILNSSIESFVWHVGNVNRSNYCSCSDNPNHDDQNST